MGVEPHILPTLERATGHVAVSFKAINGMTQLDGLFQEGCMKARFPRAVSAPPKTAILINTTGGIADGDILQIDIDARAGTTALISSQAAERIYKARSMLTPANIKTTLTVGENAALYWIPQETILFEGGAVERSYTVDIAENGRFLAAEMLVLGRTAMQETVTKASLFDRWRIRQGGKLLYADGYRLSGDINAHHNSMARLGGAAAIANLFYVGKEAESLKALLRESFDSAACEAACSVKKGILLARFAGKSALDVTAILTTATSLIDTALNETPVTPPILSRRIF